MIEEIETVGKQLKKELEGIRGRSSLYLEGSPGRDGVLAQIAAIEAHLSRLDEIEAEIGQILDNHGIPSIRELRELKKETENTIRSTGQKMWDKLVSARGAGKSGVQSRTAWLPSDICKIPEYQAQEAAAREKIERAKVDLPELTAALLRVNDLREEAQPGAVLKPQQQEQFKKLDEPNAPRAAVILK